MSAFDPEVRQGIDPRSVIYQHGRTIYRDEFLRDTKDVFEGHVKKMKAQVDLALVNHYDTKISDIPRGAFAPYEPNLTDVIIYNKFTQEGGDGKRRYDILNSAKYLSVGIPDQGLLFGSTNIMRYFTPQEQSESVFEKMTHTSVALHGTAEWVNAGVNTSAWSQTLNKFSFTFWFYSFAMHDLAFRNWFTAHDGNDYFVVYTDAGGALAVEISNGVGSGNAQFDTSNNNIGTFEWHKLTFTYDKDLGSEQCKLYIDGNFIASATYTSAIALAASTELHIGRWTPSGISSEHYSGLMRDVKFWAGTTLSATDVMNDYLGKTTLVTTPSAWFKMDEGNGPCVDSITPTKTAVLKDYALWQVPLGTESDFAWVNEKPEWPMSVKFDGANDRITCGDHASIWSKAKTKFSFAVWIYPTAGWDGNTRTIVQHDVADPHGYSMYIDSAVANRINFQLDNAAGTPLTARAVALQLYQWNRVLCVYDKDLGSANMKIYVNGVLGATTANLTETISTTGTLFLAGQANEFKGYMRKFEYWDNTALSAAEALDDYNGVFAGTPPSYRLLMNEGKGTPIDAIGGKTTTFDNGPFYGVPTLMGVGMSIGLNVNTVDPITQRTKIRHGQFLGFHTALTNDILFFDGIDDFIEQADAAGLRLTQFSIMAWVRSTRDHSATQEACIVGKGGFGSDSAGQNDNYSLIFRSTPEGTIRGGFEEGSGADHYVTSALPYNEGNWHLVGVTFDSNNLALYADGYQVIISNEPNVPETVNTNPLRLGKNPRANDRFMAGQMRGVRVWNNDVLESEALALFQSGTVPQTGAIVYSNGVTYENTVVTLTDLGWTAQNFSEQIWFKPSDLTDTGSNRILKIYTVDGTHKYSIEIDRTDNKLFLEFINGGTTTRLQSAFPVTVGGGINGWYCLTYTWATTNTLTGRLNDIPLVASSKVGHAAITTYLFPTYGGYPNMSINEEFRGLLSFFIYYKNATVLTAQEQTNLFSFGTKIKVDGKRPLIAGFCSL